MSKTNLSIRSTVGLASSGTSPGRIHLVGLGRVGRAFLRRAAEHDLRIVAATDSSCTTYASTGLDPRELVRAKESGPAGGRGSGLALTGAPTACIATRLAVELVESDVLVDACASDLRAPDAAAERVQAALDRGGRVAVASKDALLVGAWSWTAEIASGRVGWNAALGGTGRRLAVELGVLSASTESIALVANATTTAVIEGLERGLDLDAALADARARGLSEPDATLDLDGTDAAAKLAIVAGTLFGRRVELDAIEREDLRVLDRAHVRERSRSRRTTRLVARARRDGACSVRFEELPQASILAAPPDRVVYAYTSATGVARVHVGQGLGPERTADALLADVVGVEGGVA